MKLSMLNGFGLHCDIANPQLPNLILPQPTDTSPNNPPLASYRIFAAMPRYCTNAPKMRSEIK
jgi:hypothetical protein